jgi:hypothetical protein
LHFSPYLFISISKAFLSPLRPSLSTRSISTFLRLSSKVALIKLKSCSLSYSLSHLA